METGKPTQSATTPSKHNLKKHRNPDLIASILIFHLMAPVWYSSLHCLTKNCRFFETALTLVSKLHTVSHISS